MTNLKDKLHKQVYVPTSDSNDNYFAVMEDFDFKTNVLRITNSYLLSGEELLELKKQWAAEGFDAGFKKSGENMIDHMIEISKPAPDKEQYINSLTL